MAEKLWLVIPEISLFLAAVMVSVMGLSPRKSMRDGAPKITCAALAVAMGLTFWVYSDAAVLSSPNLNMILPNLGLYVKVVVCAMGILLTMLSVGLIDRRLEDSLNQGRTPFDPLRVARGEYFAFFLLSLIGVMLVCNANDLIWLFLALELTSLPTYIMIAISRGSRKAQEASVKYFFLGAMAAAMFLYGFALLYGSTGTIVLTEMKDAFLGQTLSGGINPMGILGMILALLGIAFKIAAAPMHFYTPDVYEGAASPVTAFLAFVPKTAGILAFILLLSTVGWTGHLTFGESGLPAPLLTMLWMLAVLTMTLGNIGALLQSNAKRLLAYSSIAHSGYMLIGIIAGPGKGINGVLFYLLAYGVMNTAAFAVLAGLERKGEEIESMDDLVGLRHNHPVMAAVMAISALSLIGIPPLLGFFGKLYLFVAGVEAGQIKLVIIAGINSAISAFYYLRLVGLPLMGQPNARSETVVNRPVTWARLAGVLTAAGAVLLPFVVAPLISASRNATQQISTKLPDHAQIHAEIDDRAAR